MCLIKGQVGGMVCLIKLGCLIKGHVGGMVCLIKGTRWGYRVFN